jgi:hypothetical protein
MGEAYAPSAAAEHHGRRGAGRRNAGERELRFVVERMHVTGRLELLTGAVLMRRHAANRGRLAAARGPARLSRHPTVVSDQGRGAAGASAHLAARSRRAT